ncbi:MAG: hypothetical protein Q9162_002533 [Coniocarpon cinnabarinum]
MTAEERDMFSTSVNSQIKAPNQGIQRDGQHRDISGARKMSFTQGHGGASASSPFAARPLGRRRDTNETFPVSRESITSPSTSKFERDDISGSISATLPRRMTESKDQAGDYIGGDAGREHEEEEGGGGPFGLPRRISSGPLSAGLGSPQSSWSAGGLASLGPLNGSGSIPKRPGGPNRSESRFKNLMSRESNEHILGLGTLQEDENSGRGARMSTSNSPPHEQSHSRPVGSAALGGANDDGGPAEFPASKDGLMHSHALSPRASGQFQGETASPFAKFSGPRMHSSKEDAAEPSSPAFTNPYQSPEQNLPKLHEYEGDDIDMNSLHLPGLGGIQNDSRLGNFSSGTPAYGHTSFEGHALDRNQPPPSATPRGFSGLGGLGTRSTMGVTGSWPTSYGSGTPGREHTFPGFAESHGQTESLPTQAFPGLGLASPGIDSLNDGMKGLGSSGLGSLIPSSMHEQINSGFPERSRGGYDPFSTRASEPSGFSISNLRREAENPVTSLGSQMGEGLRREERFTDPTADTSANLPSHYAPANKNVQGPQDHLQRRASSDQEPLAGQPPAAQQKTMVMPDRIRWIYRDPQGNTQGPWTGLEMHDWYRAGFFSPELLVKKVEDPDYEPLAQLIRRIGNSREPFLVPQIGIPGPPSTSGSWPTQPAAVTPSSTAAPTAQPPFASSFPSFGTTLTAEQQNALERRKQEEQYLMARQKEHLAQQQILAKQRSIPGGTGVSGMSQSQTLQHHASTQSLQSQPSYGSITAGTSGFAAAAPPSAHSTQGAFDSGYYGAQGAGAISSGEPRVTANPEDAEQMQTLPDYAQHSPQHFDGSQRLQKHQALGADEDDERFAHMLEDRARLQREQAEALQDMQNHEDEFSDQRRLQQFQELQQEQLEGEQHSKGFSRLPDSYRHQESIEQPEPQEHKLTLTEQVQKAASAKQSPSSTVQSPWANRIDRPIAESHPTSGTSSPLPAPAARRNGRQSVADALAAESSKPPSPAAETPSTVIAPWAKEASSENNHKQPSLKEIQEAEARRAAKRDEEQAALRRAAYERELANQAPAPAPGLPSSSNWASGEPVTSPSSMAPSAWAKSNTKPVATPGGSRKTLQQIQKEEEALARRQKAAATAATTVHGNTATGVSNAAQAASAGKRYADLASRVAAPSGPNAGNAWTTVGASGKVKAPATPNPPPMQRVPTGNIASATPTSGIAKKPAAAPVRSNSSATTLSAYDDFKTWAVGELRADVSKGVDPQNLVNTLLDFPPDKDLITETVHSASNTIDSRHFAEEFVKRRTLADKGKPQPPSNANGLATSSIASATAKSGGSGWSEVARKGPAPAPKEDPAFKIVPTKKKSAKR